MTPRGLVFLALACTAAASAVDEATAGQPWEATRDDPKARGTRENAARTNRAHDEATATGAQAPRSGEDIDLDPAARAYGEDDEELATRPSAEDEAAAATNTLKEVDDTTRRRQQREHHQQRHREELKALLEGDLLSTLGMTFLRHNFPFLNWLLSWALGGIIEAPSSASGTCTGTDGEAAATTGSSDRHRPADAVELVWTAVGETVDRHREHAARNAPLPEMSM